MTPEDMQERDIVEFTDDNGNTLMLEVMDYFYYNGQEFAALCNANENPGDDDPDDDAVYIMQVNTFEDENGEEMEEFVPPEEALMEKLIQVVRTRFSDEADDEGEDEAEDGERLDDGEADVDRLHDGAPGLGLAGDAVDAGVEDECHADARAECRQAVAENVQRAADLQRSHCVSFRMSSFG